MINFKLICILMSLIFNVVVFADTTTVILQNGNNGYTGCVDSYTDIENLNGNFSTDSTLKIANCQS